MHHYLKKIHFLWKCLFCRQDFPYLSFYLPLGYGQGHDLGLRVKVMVLGVIISFMAFVNLIVHVSINQSHWQVWVKINKKQLSFSSVKACLGWAESIWTIPIRLLSSSSDEHPWALTQLGWACWYFLTGLAALSDINIWSKV